MTFTDIRSSIETALSAMPHQNFEDAAVGLLGTLGYQSDLTLPGQTGQVDDFINRFDASNPGTKSEDEFREKARSVRLLFQLTDNEIASTQGSLFDAAGFDSGNAKSFLFTAVELQGGSYPRSSYAAFAREINKRWQIPTVVLFKTASNLLTLAFMPRRVNRRDESRDVLGSVSLIREINSAEPHRAHLDILSELSLDNRLKWMTRNGRSHNFDGLLAAWLDTLDTEELNRRFYRDLFAWFERAVDTAKFPTKWSKTLTPEEHVIRLITRLLFVWFIKEKGLVAENLFVEHQVSKLLKDYDAKGGDSYYRAVLQNLFFATLNTEIERRGFSDKNRDGHRDFSRFRYAGEIADSDALTDLFNKTPFINGGLFDCLDSVSATGEGGYRIDCFTDNSAHLRDYSIPNRLFFSEDRDRPGLIDLFNRYKFTVEENTPTEQEVALDPELLGKVFENLLAAYNPETRESARKQTGSYYTPRPVVDYMVEESLVAALSQKVPSPQDNSAADWEGKLRRLLDYNDAIDEAETRFEPAEREAIVRAIAGLKVLDPAGGSGAFPMGVLHKLTLALRRLDSDNAVWEKVQKQLAGERARNAFDTADQSQRDYELAEISQTFERYRDSDFGRKLYLIQNSIYGVDIQPVAAQIAKLRFFISLAIEQTSNDDSKDNYGVKPLPNLETRFVAADTLLGLERPPQLSLSQTEAVTELQRKLNENRERHLHASVRREKLRLRDEDTRLRKELADALRAAADFPAEAAGKIAAWDPYDQNASANWFDPEYMFGVTDGFDVVIGNPPYIQLQKDGGRLGNLYQKSRYATFARRGDIYQLFYERGCQLLRPQQSILTYITSNSWLKANYGKKSRRYFTENHTPLALLELGKDVFESAIVDSSVLMLRTGGGGKAFPAVDTDRVNTEDFPPPAHLWGKVQPDGDAPWSILSAMEHSALEKMRIKGTSLRKWGG